MRKLRRIVRPPRSAHDVVPNYHDYLRLQRETFLSFESEVPRWKEGQRRFVDRAMDNRARHTRVLDCAAGDGTAIAAYRGQNANMHMCEAMLAAYEATGEDQYLDRAELLAQRICIDLADQSDGLIWEHYRSDWTHDWDYNRDDPQNLFNP